MKSNLRQLTEFGVRLLGHGVVIGAILAALAAVTFDPIHFSLVARALDDESLRSQLVPLIIALIACVCGFWVATVALLTPASRAPRRVRISASRGAVLTETLIVLPVYLLLVFGLAQLTLNSMASLLATLASYESARTLAVWGPEAGVRRSVTTELAIDKARVAAASVLAPVVPEDIAVECVESHTLVQHDKGLRGVGHFGRDEISSTRRDGSLAGALDDARLAERGLPKLYRAYCQTAVRVDGGDVVPGERFVARLSFQHTNVVPLVGVIFGDRFEPGVGYVQTIERSYAGTAQLRPNSVDPACRFCPEWGNSVF